MAVNYESMSFDVYLDNVLVLKNYPLVDQMMTNNTLCRIYVENGNGKVQLCVDNFKIYEAMQPLSSAEITELESAGKISVFPTNEDAIYALSGSVSANMISGTMYFNNEKKYPALKPYIKNNEAYFPVKEAVEGFGYSYSYNNLDGTIRIGNNIIFSVGNNGSEVVEGFVFMPATTLAGLIGRKYYCDSNALVV